jgi:hypothetical protein
MVVMGIKSRKSLKLHLKNPRLKVGTVFLMNLMKLKTSLRLLIEASYECGLLNKAFSERMMVIV